MKPLRVAHVPSHHPYVDHLGFETRIGLTAVEVDVWDLDRLAAAGIDVVHMHFGFERFDAEALATWVTGLRRARIALVYTVHDLDNPHLIDQTPHHVAVEMLTARADAVVTLTPWAARELRRRTEVDACVMPHPHVVALDELRRHRTAPRPVARGVYVHAGTLRPNLDPTLLEYVAGRAPAIGGLRVHVRVGRGGEHPDAGESLWLSRLASMDGVALETTARLCDDELWNRITAARCVLLPYRWGTHSGILEAARDLGVAVVAPANAGYGDQGAVTFGDRYDCVRRLQSIRAHAPIALGERLQQRRCLGLAHERIYRRAVANVRARP